MLVCFLGRGEKETKHGWRIRKNVSTFEAMVRVELLEGDNRAMCDTYIGTIFFLVKLQGEHLPELSPVSPYSKV